MSDTGWQPVHHVEAPDDPDEPAKGGEAKPKESKGGSGETKAAVSLTLNLPDEFISAVKELAKAQAANTEAIKALLKAMGKPE